MDSPRQLSKNIVAICLTLFALFVTAVLFGSLISGAATAQNAVEHSEISTVRIESVQQEPPPIATVETDFNFIDTDVIPDEIFAMRQEAFREIGALPYVKNWVYFIEAWGGLYSNEVTRFTTPEIDAMYGGPPVGWSRFTLRSVQSDQLFDIEEGLIELVQGREFTDEEVSDFNLVALVSENFAEFNDLEVGSTFTLYNSVLDMREDFYYDPNRLEVPGSAFAQEPYEFEVVGIFVPQVQFDTGDDFMNRSFQNDLENLIYAPFPVVERAITFQFEQGVAMDPEFHPPFEGSALDQLAISNIFILESVSYMDEFRAAVPEILPYHQATAAGDVDTWHVSDFLNGFVTQVLFLLWIAAVMAALTISALFVLTARATAGIVQSLQSPQAVAAVDNAEGVAGKKQILSQLTQLLQPLAITIVGFGLSLPLGNFVAGALLEQALSADSLDPSIGMGGMSFGILDSMGFGATVAVREVTVSFDASLSGAVILNSAIAYAAVIFTAAIVLIAYMAISHQRKNAKAEI